jgi:hypothetical protein
LIEWRRLRRCRFQHVAGGGGGLRRIVGNNGRGYGVRWRRWDVAGRGANDRFLYYDIRHGIRFRKVVQHVFIDWRWFQYPNADNWRSIIGNGYGVGLGRRKFQRRHRPEFVQQIIHIEWIVHVLEVVIFRFAEAIHNTADDRVTP